MKNRVLFLAFVPFLCLTLGGCKKKKDKVVPSDFEVSCEIYYSSDGNRNNRIESTNFEINTRIFVHVDFTLKKNCSNPTENLDFIVQIPYAEYYSTKEFHAGTIIPTEKETPAQDLHGNVYMIKELSGMVFIIDDNESHPYYYVFEIEANQVCENAMFIARFEPQKYNLSIAVNGNKDDTAVKGIYSFYENQEE